MKYRSAYNEIMYHTHRNKIKHDLAVAEKDYYNKLLESNKNDMRKTWNILKGIINKKRNSKLQSCFKIDEFTVITDESMVSKKFNDFFVNIGPSLASKIPYQTTSSSSYLCQEPQHSTSIYPVDLKEVDDIISSLRKCAPGSQWGPNRTFGKIFTSSDRNHTK